MTDKYEQASEVFHLLSHPARLQILDELRRDPACVCHLEAVLNKAQAYVSQQLRVLREAGAVSDRRDGLFVYYRLVDDQVEQVLEEVLGPSGTHTEPVECPCPHCGAE
jgi:ArsR family transcriptional regulator